MDIISIIVWVILICGVAALCFWLARYAPVDFQRPIRIVIFVVAAIFLVYLLGGMLLKMAPPFPGMLTPRGAYAAECQSRTWASEPGKTKTYVEGHATDGCNTYTFKAATDADGPARGEVTFRTSHIVQGYEAGNTLPSMADGYCQYAAAHQANLTYVYYFGVPDGTEVRVTYSCR